MKKFFKLNNYLSFLLFLIFLIKYKVFYKNRISFGKNLKFNKHADIKIVHGSKLFIGDNVTLNSNNNGYHINMHSPVKLVCDREGATIRIGNNTRIHGSCIHAFKSISIGNNCLIAANCQIFDSNGHDLSFDNPSERINTTGGSKPIIIENNVWITANCIILPGSHISEGCVVSAGSVVDGYFPKNNLIKGNPAIFVERNDNNE
jgi:acetyltransferase-like isoleucine patch superfamily enzyme